MSASYLVREDLAVPIPAGDSRDLLDDLVESLHAVVTSEVTREARPAPPEAKRGRVMRVSRVELDLGEEEGPDGGVVRARRVVRLLESGFAVTVVAPGVRDFLVRVPGELTPERVYALASWVSESSAAPFVSNADVVEATVGFSLLSAEERGAVSRILDRGGGLPLLHPSAVRVGEDRVEDVSALLALLRDLEVGTPFEWAIRRVALR